MLTILSLALIAGGCTVINPVVPESGHYYINPGSDFASIARVTIFELDNHTDYPSLSGDIASAINRELQKKHLFNTSVLQQSSSEWIDLELDDADYSNEEMSSIGEQLNTDAIIIGSISEYRPYPQMLVSLNLRMLDLRSGQIVWGTEQLWDSTDNNLARRMKVYYRDHMRTGYEPIDWELLYTSPRAFNRFVAYEVAQTFPRASEYMKLRLSSENSENFRKKPVIYKKINQIPLKELKLSQSPATIDM